MRAPGVPAGAQNNCRLNIPMDFTPIPPQHLSISGTLTTSNAIMATWSREMWQSVVNRILRMITSGPFRTQFAYGSCHRHITRGDDSSTGDDVGSSTAMKNRYYYHLKPSTRHFIGGVQAIELVGSKCYSQNPQHFPVLLCSGCLAKTTLFWFQDDAAQNQ
ncbi:hypothetical protein KIN20_014914 [Parelaphostrongylus tenuis]|uniref:Uncharacterized protein n=1 Tax=Parelaphostrongylus tenuis TaxID=148309 RepID=A0AAD5MHM2_PARTN|nr:hypothetical protein KIN20_014914 [Parelaphostrongylus tenuis]